MKPYYCDEGAGITIYHARAEDVVPTLEPGSVDLVLTDPPYSVSVAGSFHKGQPGKGRRRLDFFVGDDDWRATRGMVVSVLKQSVRLMTSTASAYCWLGHRQFGAVVAFWESRGFSTRFLVWQKEVVCPPPPGSGWPSGAELCVYAYRPGRTWNHRGKNTPRSNVLLADSYRFGQPGKVDHPTQKPIGVIAPLILASSRPGDLVLDMFAGSGTTLRVAKDLGRRAIGVEREERYCEIAAGRLAQGAMLLEEVTT